MVPPEKKGLFPAAKCSLRGSRRPSKKGERLEKNGKKWTAREDWVLSLKSRAGEPDEKSPLRGAGFRNPHGDLWSILDGDFSVACMELNGRCLFFLKGFEEG